MSNFISEHLHPDEQQQRHLEAHLASTIKRNYTENISAFQTHIPTLGQQLTQFMPQTTSVFVNKLSQLNIVNFTTGNVLYPVDGKAAIANQLRFWEQRSIAYDLVNGSARYKMQNDLSELNDLGAAHFAQIKKMQQDIDTLVLLGIGSGQYIIDLLQQFTLKYVLMYEPNWQLLYSSLSMCNWREIFDYCEAHGITIFIQTTTAFESDLAELAQSTDAKNAMIFQHLHTREFDDFVRRTRFDLHEFSEHESQCAEMEIWQSTSDLSEWQLYDGNVERFDANLRALQAYYPDIAQLFSSYEASLWLPVQHRQSKEVSLFNRYAFTIYSPKPSADADNEFDVFCKYPNREQLYMGYMGNKLNHFAFNHFYTEIGAVLSSQEQSRAVLPDTLELLIIFGLGNAYHLDSIATKKNLRHLFFVEPNPDFFYWSLLVADWPSIFESVIQSDGKMYLSIGQLDKGLTGELNRQYAYIGNHHVAKTWIFQGYRTPTISVYLNDVRSTFKTLFSISDNFNHCFYGLEHFLYSVEKKFSYMTNKVKTQNKTFGNVPVFMVGNGPSVDNCIEQLKAYQDQAIIVSCGTTLKTLYNYGIVPDYHAEVESYRANYDWITQIPDRDYLSKITLISPDGLHPDNTTLFKNTLFALKNGESATVIYKYLFPDHDYVMLSEAYPTVSNFCLTFLIHAGFREIYMLGVDLGYIDPDRHHGQNSSYFEKDKTLYTVAKDEANILQVEGNFLPRVLTKYEFNMARNIMEQAIKKAKVDCYNTANGAKIMGTVPLQPDDIMILTSASDKQAAISAFESAFSPLSDDFMQVYEEKFQPQRLSESIAAMSKQLPVAFSELAEVERLVSTHDSILREDKSNLLVLTLLPSTIQCFFAALIKSSLVADKEIALIDANRVLGAYRELLFKAEHLTKNVPNRWDISVAFIERREQSLLDNMTLTMRVADTQVGEFFQKVVSARQINVEVVNDLDAMADITFVNDLRQLDIIASVLATSDRAEGLLLCFDIDVACAAHQLCLQHSHLAVLYYDLSDYLALAHNNGNVRAEDTSLPLIEHIATTLQARFSQRFDFSAMYYKPRFDMQPHIRKLSSDPSHPVNWQGVTKVINEVNRWDLKVIFKHFIAIPRLSDQNGTVLDTGTVIDKYGNRGMYIERQVYPMEVLDYCYISSNRHQFEECIQEYLARV